MNKKEYSIKNKSSFADTMIGKLDATWANMFLNKNDTNINKVSDAYKDFDYKTDGEYHYINRIPIEVIDIDKLDWLVKYKYNKDWFRSDNFKKNHDGLHVLFAGCSNTEGVGLNIEETWSNLVYEELKKTYKLSGYFNIAKGGYGWEKMVSSITNYIDKYSKPDVLIINHPNILRNYHWVPSINKWIYAQKLPYSTQSNNKYSNKTHEDILYEEISFNRYPTLEDSRDFLPNWATAWNLFLVYCKSIGIQVIWTCWDYQETENIQSFDIFSNTFFELQPPSQQWIQNKRPNLKFKQTDMNARDGHPGYLIQLCWSEQFMQEINKKGVIDEIYKKYN